MVAAYVLSAACVLVAGLGSLAYLETASVKVSVPPKRLEADVTLNGGVGLGHDLATQHVDATVTESLQGTASTVQISATSATGQVLFTYSCLPVPCLNPITLPSGTIVSTVQMLHFATQAPATLKPPSSTVEVPVRAVAPGAAGNTSKETITVIDKNPAPQNLRVTNPAPTTGGADGRTVQIIQQSDYDAVRTMLATKVTEELDAALKAKAPGTSYAPDGPPLLTVASDHAVGDETPTFTLMMTGSLGVTAFSDGDARRLLRSALEAKLPASEQWTSDPIETSYQIQQASLNGDVTISGVAIGYVTPRLSVVSLRTRIRGLSLNEARSQLRRVLPGSQIEIRTSPKSMPWLPLNVDRISLTVFVEPAPLLTAT